MCGIIGIAGKNISNQKEHIDTMLKTLSRRGPDDHGSEFFNHCILGQTRLSIIDLSAGHQPMKDNKSNLTITFNGEIYNYLELRKNLEEEGHVFSTHSDTEVILKAYAEYGEDCCKYLDGMFAFAIWDERQQSLFIARDRFGKKPLFYVETPDGTFIFASEIKAILSTKMVSKDLNLEAIDHYLTYMYIAPSMSAYKNIKPLLPAHTLIYKNNKIEIKKYWHLTYNPEKISYRDAKTQVKHLLKESVKKRLVADVEIGTLLSGGIDSTIVTAYAQEQSSRPLKTFSLGYGKYINELPYAKQASETLGTENYTYETENNLQENLIEVIKYFDEPHADSSNFPQYLISKLTSSKVKVALTGDGADELFMGYGWYWRYWNLSYRSHTKEKLFTSQYMGFQKSITIFSEMERNKLMKDTTHVSNHIPDFTSKYGKIPDIQKINLFDLTTYLPGQLLTKVDRTSMMNSLEIRCPFLDYKLAEFVFNLPLEYKTDKKNGKIILKDILSEIMPHDFVYRRKQGFGAPVRQWLKEEKFKKFVTDILLSKNADVYTVVYYEHVNQMISDFYTKNKDEVSYKIWLILCLELWLNSQK